MMKDDGFFWYRETRIPIPGVKGEHLLMHITDTHVSTMDEGSSPEEREETEKQETMWASFKEKFARGQLPFAVGTDEPYGDAQRISTVAAFEKLMALAEELKPEALLLSGDNLERMHGAGERYLRRKLGEYGGKFLCVPGNHEDPACEGVWAPGVHTLELEGFRINKAENNRLFPYKMPAGLRAGTALYRNNDMAFERLMAGKTAQRKVEIAMTLSETPAGFRLQAGQAVVEVETGKQKARTPQSENIVRQLTKLGNTPFACSEVCMVPQPFDFFIPSSLLAVT